MNNQPHQSTVHQQFDSKSSAYLESKVHAQGEDLAFMTNWLKTHVNQENYFAALDMGTGAGHVAYQLAQYYQQVVAYDLSEQMLATVAHEAKKRGLHTIQTQQGSVERMPFENNTFDMVTTRYSAHHWLNPTRGIREAYRVLKPGGYAIFMDIISPEQSLYHTWLQSFEVLRDTSHNENLRLSTWTQYLSDAGFNIQTSQVFKVTLDFNAWVKRSQTTQEGINAIRYLQSHAPAEINDYFCIEKDGSFTEDSGLILAKKL